MRRLIISVSLPLLLLAGTASAEIIPFNLEIGYRWTTVDGNEGVYRSQINEQSGLILRAFSLSTPDFRIDATDLGASPAGTLRLEASSPRTYRLRLTYRQMDAFSDLPGYANPLLSQGVLFGQHTLDRTRTMVDADVEILPGRAITPFIGYSWNRNDGPGQTTYFLGQDEFRLSQELRETDRELRAGASFRYQMVYGQLTQGWRTFRGDEQLTLASGAGAGNNIPPVLGTPVTADQFTSTNRTSVDTPFTNAFVTVRPITRLKVIANYVRFAADGDENADESANGAFISFPISRAFGGLTENVSGRMKNTTWRGGARGEFMLMEGIDLLAGYQREHRELEGSALINTLYLRSVTFGGLDPRDVRTILNTSNSLDRDEDVFSAGISARAFGPFSVHAEFRQSSQDFLVAPDLEEIVVPGNQGGAFDRRIRTFDVGGAYTNLGFTLAASWKNDSADNPVFRTDFIDRDRYRARAGWATRQRTLSFGLAAEQTDQQNQSEIGFDGTFRQMVGDVEYAPIPKLRLRASVSRFESDTSILYRRPETFAIETSVHEESGSAHEGGIALMLARGTLDAGYSRFSNSGTFPFDIDRYRLRATLNLKAKTGVAAEWNRDKYGESALPISDFEADRFGLYFVYRP